MALSGSTVAMLQKGKDAFGKVGIGAALNVGFAYFDYRSRLRQGQNPVVAGAVSGGTAFLAATMGFLPFMLTVGGYAAMKGGVSAFHTHHQTFGAFSRRMSTPFSHSFSHTDATYQMQQRGLQALGAGRGAVGAEAGMMSQLYGRR